MLDHADDRPGDRRDRPWRRPRRSDQAALCASEDYVNDYLASANGRGAAHRALAGDAGDRARTGAIKPADLSCVIVDTTVQPKNITFPTDAKLMNRAREKFVTLARNRKRMSS